MSGAESAAQIPGFTSETADVGGLRRHYRLGGDPEGPPVLLWHGFPAPADKRENGVAR